MTKPIKMLEEESQSFFKSSGARREIQAIGSAMLNGLLAELAGKARSLRLAELKVACVARDLLFGLPSTFPGALLDCCQLK